MAWSAEFPSDRNELGGAELIEPRVPDYRDLLWPTLKALESKGGSASIDELSECIAEILELPDAVLEISHSDGPQSEVDYRAAWARTHLRLIGAVENSARGVWALTDIGRHITSEAAVRQIARDAKTQRRAARRSKKAVALDDADDPPSDGDWKDNLLRILRSIKPDEFERLCQRILRESGFTKVEVSGRSGDGGIDGAGVIRINLLSFHVRFQCKRYSGSVASSEIRDFRGAFVGRADKGLFITTGRFTKEAEREAVRDGAPAIDLIDGLELCDLIKSLGLGVKLTVIENVEIVPSFFEGF